MRQWLYWPVQPFIWHPIRIGFVSLVFLGAWFIFRRWSSGRSLVRPQGFFVLSIAWAIFALWECYCTVRQFNIRVDILLLWPPFAALTLGALIACLRWRKLGGH
jgi:hypothetical protein